MDTTFKYLLYTYKSIKVHPGTIHEGQGFMTRQLTPTDTVSEWQKVAVLSTNFKQMITRAPSSQQPPDLNNPQFSTIPRSQQSPVLNNPQFSTTPSSQPPPVLNNPQFSTTPSSQGPPVLNYSTYSFRTTTLSDITTYVLTGCSPQDYHQTLLTAQ